MNSLTGKEHEAVTRAAKRQSPAVVTQMIIDVLSCAAGPMTKMAIGRAIGYSGNRVGHLMFQHRMTQVRGVVPCIRIAEYVTENPGKQAFNAGFPAYEISDAPDAKPKTGFAISGMVDADDKYRTYGRRENAAAAKRVMPLLRAQAGNPFGLHFVWMGVAAL